MLPKGGFFSESAFRFSNLQISKKKYSKKTTLQISIGWLSVISSVIPLALKGILPICIIPIGKIL